MRAMELLHERPEGLYVPPADLYIDPLVPVPRAVVTHGHADHARAGHGAVLATPETLAIMAVRYGQGFCGTRQPLPHGERLVVEGVEIALHPAGHVLGSAQVAIAHRGLRITVTGDYKREADPTCRPFELVPCDVLVTEATFGLPVFRHPPAAAEIEKLLASLRLFPGRTHLVGAYALGKAQRLIALLRAAGWDRPIWLHGALLALTRLYRELGVDLGDIRPVGRAGSAELAGAVVLCPPSAMQTPWARRFSEPLAVLASGWMRIRARARQRGVELPLVVSDHADWPDLGRTIEESGAAEVWITHGEADALAHWCKGGGPGLKATPVAARALHLVGYGDDGGNEEGTTETPAAADDPPGGADPPGEAGPLGVADP